MHARYLIRRVCAQHVEETPLNESPREEISRAIRSCAALTASLGARVNPIFMREVIRIFEELHTVHTGTHDLINQNAALTINNVPDLIDRYQAQINKAITELLEHTEPLPMKVNA
jgi:predicted Rossmann fold nucleotide-binding protein DprA/Smf involved in DNA uptake